MSDRRGGPRWQLPNEWQSEHLYCAERRQSTILVVDDDRAKRYAMVRALTAAGFSVGEAGNGGDALAAFGSYAAIVLDVHLPDIDGFELCRRIRAAAPGVPIVQVSSVMVDPGYQRVGQASGADAYLPDPSMQELVRTLDELLASKPPGAPPA